MTRVTALRVHRRAVPLLRPFITAVRRADALDIVLVEAVDSEHRSGWGEAAVSWRVTGESPESVAAAVAAPLSDAVVGRDPSDPELPALIARAVWGNTAARSAVEVALADLAAAAAGVSLPRLLGAPAASVRTDMTLSAAGPSELAERAQAHVAEGFDVLKIKADAAHDALAGVKAVRAAVGAGVGLRVDANQAWSPDAAIRFITACEDAGLDLEFVEQPVAAHDLDGLARVTAASSTAVVADEAVRTAHDVAVIAARGAADQVNVKLAKAGGLAEARRAAEVAAAAGLGVIIGCMAEGPVGVAAAASLAAAVAPGRVHDLDAALWLSRSPVHGGARFAAAMIELSDGPGLGVRGLAGV